MNWKALGGFLLFVGIGVIIYGLFAFIWTVDYFYIKLVATSCLSMFTLLLFGVFMEKFNEEQENE